MQNAIFALGDGFAVARRNVIKIGRVPEILFGVAITPLVFVMLFAFVFGGSIDIPGGSYREFLIGGTFAQILVFGATFTGAGLAEDMQKGIIDRFRSLPMSRSAVVFGRTASDVIYNVVSLVVMAIAGLIVGWRIHNGFGNALLAFGLLLLFAYAISWVMAYVGLLVPSPEVVNNASFMVIFPMTFIANTFVPAENLPGPFRVFAEWNPVSAVAQAARELFGNIPPGTPEPGVWSLQNPVLYTLLWVAILIAVFAPLSVRRYRRASKTT
ncbi:MAG: ABC transporter permease [Acidimicrobiia bacterium]|nr:ABC transporter permease [Acidimicrobiia bacterium]